MAITTRYVRAFAMERLGVAVRSAVAIGQCRSWLDVDHGRYYRFSIAKPNIMHDRDLYSGLIRLHILHHAVKEPIFGLGIIEELGRHGYKLSAGTLYPILHGLEKRGYLRATEEQMGKRFRRVYRGTANGRKALEAAKEKVQELFGELFEEDEERPHSLDARIQAKRTREREPAG